MPVIAKSSVGDLVVSPLPTQPGYVIAVITHQMGMRVWASFGDVEFEVERMRSFLYQKEVLLPEVRAVIGQVFETYEEAIAAVDKYNDPSMKIT